MANPKERHKPHHTKDSVRQNTHTNGRRPHWVFDYQYYRCAVAIVKEDIFALPVERSIDVGDCFVIHNTIIENEEPGSRARLQGMILPYFTNHNRKLVGSVFFLLVGATYLSSSTVQSFAQLQQQPRHLHTGNDPKSTCLGVSSSPGQESSSTATMSGVPKYFQHEISITAPSRGCHLITNDIMKAASKDMSAIKIGMCNLFIQHTSASLTINENADPDVRR